MHVRTIAFAVLGALVADVASAHDGDFDHRLQSTGRLRVNLPSGHSIETTVHTALRADGSILLAASDDPGIGVQPDFNVMQLHPDGSLDTSFGVGGVRHIAFDYGGDNYDEIGAIALQGDGKLVVAGTSSADPSTVGSDCTIVRLTTSGQLDPSFSGDGIVRLGFDAGPDGQKQDQCHGVTVRGDGKVVLAGNAQAGNYFTFAAARLNSDGSPDLTFGPGGKRVYDLGSTVLGGVAQRALPLAGGKTLLVGTAVVLTSPVTGSADWTFLRINDDGTRDATFGNNGLVTYAFDLGGNNDEYAYDATLLPDGSFVVVGGVRTGVSNVDIAVAKFDASGNLVTGFGNGGRTIVAFDFGGDDSDAALAVARDAQDRLVVVGEIAAGTNNKDMAVLRLLPNGQLDADPARGFGNGGRLDVQLSVSPTPDYTESASDVAIAADGSIVVVGGAGTTANGMPSPGVARLIGDTIFGTGFEG